MHKKSILLAENLTYELSLDRTLFQKIQVSIEAGDRIAIIGANGSGKSSLVKAILGMENQTAIFDSGEVLLASAMKAVYLDQTYELGNRQYTLLENMQAANPNLSYQLLRQQLGHFLFKYDDVHKSASILSGGELARLALATISISQIDLLILDEPTTNLDIETVEQIIVGINDYQGAIWVISHDLDFLSRINITQSFKLKEQALQMTTYLPSTPEQYYRELLECTIYVISPDRCSSRLCARKLRQLYETVGELIGGLTHQPQSILISVRFNAL